MLRTLVTLTASVVALCLVVYFLRTMLGTDPEALARMIDRADKLVVLKGPDGDRPGVAPTVLFESTDRKDFDALKTALGVRIPHQTLHCACLGAERIELFANGKSLGWVSNQHCKNIRFSAWHTDAELLDPEAFVTWFDQRKIPGPREYVEIEKAREKEAQEAQRKWVAAMPSSLQPFWPQMKHSFETDPKPLLAALAKEIPDQQDRILALFSWYGCGAGPWSGYPNYENVPEKMLWGYSTGDLLAAVNRGSLTGAQTEGAARFFGGWVFSQRRPNDFDLLSADFKKKLLKHSLASKDEDNRKQAAKAFTEK